MGAKTKGGMWCDYCRRPTLGVKGTHRVRNAGAVGGTVMTGGLSLLFATNEKYVCQGCGSQVQSIRDMSIKCPYCQLPTRFEVERVRSSPVVVATHRSS
jgi:hypothetical protein